MARLPDQYSLNGGLAFQGQPAHGNAVAAQELKAGPTATQVQQSLQQSQQGMAQNDVTSRSQQMAAMLASAAKTRLQQATLAGNPEALPGLQAIAANPEIPALTGMPLA